MLNKKFNPSHLVKSLLLLHVSQVGVGYRQSCELLIFPWALSGGGDFLCCSSGTFHCLPTFCQTVWIMHPTFACTLKQQQKKSIAGRQSAQPNTRVSTGGGGSICKIREGNDSKGGTGVGQKKDRGAGEEPRRPNPPCGPIDCLALKFYMGIGGSSSVSQACCMNR